MPDIDLISETAAAQDGVVTARQCQAAGMGWNEIARRCRNGQWRALFRGVYYLPADSGAAIPVRAQIRAGLLAAGPGATAVLTSAGYLHGLPYLPEDPAVQVSVPGERNRLDQPGLLVRQLVIPDHDRALVAGMPATSPVRTVADLVLRLNRFDAVAIVDGALRAGLLEESDRWLVAARLRGRRGAVRGRRCLALADGRAASPLETRIRLVCVDGGVAPEELQYAVCDEHGRVLAVGDLAWPSRRVIVEADGGLVHGTAAALYHDRRRQNELAARGWTVIRFTWADLARPGYVVNAVRRALAAASTRVDHGVSVRPAERHAQRTP
jgi:hypothetical protein